MKRTFFEHKSDKAERNQLIYSFLSTHPIGVLASVDPNGNPHAAVVYFSVDKNFVIMFTTKNETKKNDNIKHNKHVMLICYESASQTTVQIIGSVNEITDVEKLERIFAGTMLASMQTSDSGIPPIAKLHAGNYVGFVLYPKSIAMSVYGQSNKDTYESFEIDDF